MKSKIKTSIKIIIILTLILLLSILIYTKLTNKIVLALSGGDATKRSLERPIESASDWTTKKDVEGKRMIKNPPVVPTLSKLLPSNQVKNGSVFISYEDLLSIPSLFCSACGVALPSKKDTIVSSGGRSTTVTDQGKETALLTTNDIPGATVFRNLNEWIGYTTAGPEVKYPDTTSRTYGRFILEEIRDATPAEAWVLAEYDKNVPGTAGTVITTGN